MRQWSKHLILGGIGGLLYVALELIWRGYSHWTMFFLGGICFIAVGAVNELIPWCMPLWQQTVIGTAVITGLEFLAGCIVNLWLGWGVWDYSGIPGNILGQICLSYIMLWIPVSLAAIVLDDCLRHWLFRECQPHYNVGFTRDSSKILWIQV